MFESISILLNESKTKGIPLHELIINDEMEFQNIPKQIIIEKLNKSLIIMKQSLEKSP